MSKEAGAEHAARQRLGVDVILTHDLAPPMCPHGPTLLFERFVKGWQSRRFFACAAYRDRKDCAFYCEEEKARRDNEKGQTPKAHHQALSEAHGDRSIHHANLDACVNTIEGKGKPFTFCHTCHYLVSPKKAGEHSGHTFHQQPITKEVLAHPTRLLRALDDNKTHAQFLFSAKSVDFIVQSVKSLGFKNVLCVGTPRLHEAIQLQDGMTSLLLDLDGRYAQFYPTTFCLFNMCNGHIFNQSDSARYETFLQTCDVMIVDPPFGALAEILAWGLGKIEDEWKNFHPEGSSKVDTKDALPVLFVFPYYLEDAVTRAMPMLSVLDYHVEYENHGTYHGGAGEGKKKGSPVRIFTNIPPSVFRLPPEEGYKWCDQCQRDVAPANQHCPTCNTCPTRDGPTYRHCAMCKQCVKPTRSHCTTCGTCELPGHDCQKRSQPGCHICGSEDHKRRNCPQSTTAKLKRKNDNKNTGNPQKRPKPADEPTGGSTRKSRQDGGNPVQTGKINTRDTKVGSKKKNTNRKG